MLSYNSSHDISPSQPFKIVSKFFIFPKMLGSNPNIPSIYPSLLSLIFVSRPLYYSTTTTSSLPPPPSPILRREQFRGNRANVFARARELLEREWATWRRGTGKNKGGGKLRKKHGMGVNSGEQGQRKGLL